MLHPSFSLSVQSFSFRGSANCASLSSIMLTPKFQFAVCTLVLLAAHASSLHAQSAGDIYKKILSHCAKSDEIGKDTIFFGVSNSLGPGSVWRRESDDKSIRLRFELSDAFPQSTDQQKLFVSNQM